MKTLVFGFALADSMFENGVPDNIPQVIRRTNLSPASAVRLLEKSREEGTLVVACNPSHKASIEAAKVRYGIGVDIPATPPRVWVAPGDSLLVMGVRGLPRLTDRHEYTAEEVDGASFSFSLYEVLGG